MVKGSGFRGREAADRAPRDSCFRAKASLSRVPSAGLEGSSQNDTIIWIGFAFGTAAAARDRGLRGVSLIDRSYKHFNQAAVFNALPGSALEAAREVASDSFGEFEVTPDGFTARGFSGWHNAIATFRIAPVPEGTRLTIELRVERAAMRGYMLFDIGNFYNGQIDKWFSAIGERLAGTGERVLVSKTTANLKTQRGCRAGCLVYLLVGACLTIVAIPLDQALFKTPSSSVGPFITLASCLGLLAGLLAFLYFMYPDAPAAKTIRRRFGPTRDKTSE